MEPLLTDQKMTQATCMFADMLLQRWNEKDYGEHRNGQKGMDVPERR